MPSVYLGGALLSVALPGLAWWLWNQFKPWDAEAGTLHWGSLLFLLAFWVAAVTVPVLFWRGLRRERRLVERGAVELGQITDVEVFRRRGSHVFIVHYDFVTPRGFQYSGKATDLTGDLAQGQTFRIYYDPQRPKVHVVDFVAHYEESQGVPPRHVAAPPKPKTPRVPMSPANLRARRTRQAWVGLCIGGSMCALPLFVLLTSPTEITSPLDIFRVLGKHLVVLLLLGAPLFVVSAWTLWQARKDGAGP
jgi:hypothetical protein